VPKTVAQQVLTHPPGLEPDCEGVEPVSNHPITPLASSEIHHDQLKIELVEPETMPAMVRIVWPPQPTVVDPKRFPDIAAAIAQLFTRAHIVLAALKTERKL
jgi:hypothetical protein